MFPFPILLRFSENLKAASYQEIYVTALVFQFNTLYSRRARFSAASKSLDGDTNERSKHKQSLILANPIHFSQVGNVYCVLLASCLSWINDLNQELSCSERETKYNPSEILC